MSPKDVAGIFSRYYVIGFFLPAFFTLVALSQLMTVELLPGAYERRTEGAQVAILGGTSVLLGLLLLGLNWPIFRLIEGYPLLERRNHWPFRTLTQALVGLRARAFRRLARIRDSDDSPSDARGHAAWKLDREFPDREDAVLPTRFGNAVRAFEVYGQVRWGLDSVAAWPRIDMLLNERESELQTAARGEVAFFINAALMASATGIVLVVDESLNNPLQGFETLFLVVPFLLSYFLYRWAVGAAIRWGSVVRSAIDLKRLTLYEQLGLREPTTFTEERDVIAPAVNEAFVYGYPIPDQLRARKADNGGKT